MNAVGDIGEFGLIDLIKARFEVPDGTLGIGDDCAIVPAGANDTLLSTDMLVEGVHFLADKISPEELGWKSVAVNLSDVAAMGGRAVGTLLSIALPPTTPTAWAERFIEGYSSASQRYGAALLGGDTTSSKQGIVINVAIIGSCARGRAKLRSAARAGDLVCVTGTLGDSGGGLRVILENRGHDADAEYLLDRHLHPTPRMEWGAMLGASEGVGAMMDISDGIASELCHIMRASGVGAAIDLDRLPISEELRRLSERYDWSAERLAASAGEDYELLFTLTPETATELPFAEFTVIGRIVEGSELTWLRDGRAVKEDIMGFRHF